MRLGLLTAPFPETPLDEVVDWTAAQRLREHRDRLLAEDHRPDPALCRDRHIDVANLSARRGHGARAARSRPRA